MPYKRLVCIIIDGYSTGKFLAPALISRGYVCIHIHSSSRTASKKQLVESGEYFIDDIIYDHDIERLLAYLNLYNVKFCIPGSESGVRLADQINHALSLPGNDIRLSEARRNKYLMIEAVRQENLSTPKHYKSDHLETILQWVEEEMHNQYPIVLKPLESASSDGIFICQTRSEIINAFENIIQTCNLFDTPNKEVLAESYTGGQEYIINTVTTQKNHFISEIWRVHKLPFSIIMDRCEIVHHEESEFETLSQYVKGVLNALGVNYGAAITEVKLTENGPIILESTARLMGASELSLSSELFGYTQLSLMIEAYFEPETFLARLERPRQQRHESALGVLLISNATGKLTRPLDLSSIEDLNCVHSFDIDLAVGKETQHTVDLLTCPGCIYFLGRKEDVEYAYQLVRQLEREGLYEEATRTIETTPTIHINRFDFFYHRQNNHQKKLLRPHSAPPALN